MHIMLDLETLSTSPNALILSIGAVKFDPLASEVGEKFHVGVDLASFPSKAYGLDIDPATVNWWMNADRAPGRAALDDIGKTDLPSALEGFALWMGDDAAVWGNGASFDNVVLRNAFEKLGMPAPWGFWNDRCYRTFKALLPSLKIERLGAHHSALDDALSQAVHLQKIVARLGLEIVG